MFGRGVALILMLCTALHSGCSSRDYNVVNFAKGPHLSPAELPEHIPGEYFSFDSERNKIITSQQGDSLIWKDDAGELINSHRNFIYPIVTQKSKTLGNLESTISGLSGNLWPLSPGNKTRFWSTQKIFSTPGMIDSYVERWNSCSVEGTARVTVPAGTFNTHVVTCVQYSTLDHTWRGTKRFYYSEDIGYYVQLVKRAAGKEDSIEKLVKYGFSSKYLTPADQMSLQKLLFNVLNQYDNGRVANWQSKSGDVLAILLPNESYVDDQGVICRNYTSTFMVNGRKSVNSRDMCKSDDNVWQRLEKSNKEFAAE